MNDEPHNGKTRLVSVSSDADTQENRSDAPDGAETAEVTPQETARNGTRIAREAPDANEGDFADAFFSQFDRQLTRAERSALVVLADPQFFRKDAKQCARAANVGLRTWWRILSQPDLLGAVRIARQVALNKNSGGPFAALIQAASNPDPRNAADRRLFFEISGNWVPHQQIDIGAAKQPPIGIVNVRLEDLL